MAKEKPIGVVTHYFNHLNVAIVKLKQEMKKGAKVRFLGHTTDFEMEVAEMQYDHKDIEGGKKGQEVGIKVRDHVREGDEVLAA
jgi:putative protease